MTLAVAGALFFAGRAQVVGDTLGWAGMMVALGAAVALMFYFQRAYGFVSRGWGHAPMGAVMAAIGGFLFAFQFVPAALYERIFQQSLLGYSMVCLTVALLPVGILRATLGRAPDAAPADGQAEPAGGNPGR